MNCFHFTVSLRYNTTQFIFSIYRKMLWIAFILLYLWDTTQPFHWSNIIRIRCELLSFYCIFEIQHNLNELKQAIEGVVNCFHFTVSLRYNTTNAKVWRNIILLWIAFILLYLWDTTQQVIREPLPEPGCELLSFYCILEIQHNNLRKAK